MTCQGPILHREHLLRLQAQAVEVSQIRTLMPLLLYPGLSPPIHLVNLERFAEHREKPVSFQLRQVADSGLVEMRDLDTRADPNDQADAVSCGLLRHGA